MKFSLRTLLLTMTMLPPVIGFVVLHVLRMTKASQLRFPDPILSLGIIGWLAAYTVLVRDESAGSTAGSRPANVVSLARFRVGLLEVPAVVVLFLLALAALGNPIREVAYITRLVAFCLAAAALIVACNPESKRRWPATAAFAGGVTFLWLVAEQFATATLIPLWYSRSPLPPAQRQHFVDIASVTAAAFAGLFLGYLVRVFNASDPPTGAVQNVPRGRGG